MLHEKLNLIVMKYNYHFLKERYLGSMGETYLSKLWLSMLI